VSALDERWHGWRVGAGKSIHVGPLPARKSVALYAAAGGRVDVLAYFRNEEDAERALALIDRLAGASVT
jgi:hypothetical protein